MLGLGTVLLGCLQSKNRDKIRIFTLGYFQLLLNSIGFGYLWGLYTLIGSSLEYKYGL